MGIAYSLHAFATRQLVMKPARIVLDRPIASITFDDFPRSAWTAGGPILDRFGVKATYYAVGGYCGRTVDGVDQYDADDLRAAHAAGHEIGCHTFGHQHGRRMATPTLEADMVRNREFLVGVLGDGFAAETFAYPYGEVSPRSKALYARAFPASRGIRPGVNVGLTDLSQLKSFPLEQRSWSQGEVERLVAQAKATNGWLTFFTHDVSDAPTPYGCTPAMLEHALAAVEQAGFEVLPMKDALSRALA